MREAPGGDFNGRDPGLQAARATAAWGSAREAPDDQWTELGSVAGAFAGSRCWALVDPARNAAASPDSDPWERVGRGQGRLAGSRYGGAVRRQCGRRVRVDGGWGG